MIKRIIIFVLLVSILAAILTGCTQEIDTSFDINTITSFREIPGITDDEIKAVEAVLARHDSFSFMCMPTTEAFPINGSHIGFTQLFTEFLSQLFGIPFKLETNGWSYVLDGITGKTVDFTGDMTPTPERALIFSQSNPIAQRTLGVFTYGDSISLKTEEDLNGLRIGFREGSVFSQKIRDTYPNIEFESVYFTSDVYEIDLLEAGEIDAYISEAIVASRYLYNENVKVREMFPLIYGPVSLTTGNPELSPIIDAVDKYIAAGGGVHLRELYKDGKLAYSRYVFYKSFTDEDRTFLDNLTRTIPIVARSDNYPVTFFNRNEGEFQGISLDILSEVSKLTGIEFEIINTPDTPFSDLLGMLQSGEASIITSLPFTDARVGMFRWVEPNYLSSNYVFISKDNLPRVNLSEISHLNVGVIAGTSLVDTYIQLFPELSNLVLYATNSEAFDALENGQIDLFFSLDYVLRFQVNYREKLGYKINYSFPATLDTFFGLNVNEETLLSIIEKAMNYVDTEMIVNEWNDRVFDYSRVIAEQRVFYLTMFLFVTSVSVIMLIAFLIVNTRKSKAIKEKDIHITEANTRLKLMINSIPLACSLVDRNLNIIDINRETLKLFNIESKPEITGKRFDMLLPDIQPDGSSSIDFATSAINEAYEDGVCNIQNAIFQTLDGKLIPTRATLRCIEYAGELLILASIFDLSDESRMLEEIEEYTAELEVQLAKMNLMTKAANIALWDLKIVSTDPANPKYEVIWTKEFRNMLGFSDEDEFPDQLSSWSDRLHEDDKERAPAALVAHINDHTGNTPFDIEYMLKMKTGEYRYFHAYGETLRNSKGVPIRTAGALMDITNDKQIAETLKSALESAKDADRAKTAFLAKMSHEIRTPMNSIIGFSELALDDDDLSVETGDFIQKIINNAKWLLQIINDILDISKIESGKIALEYIPFNLADIFAHCKSVISPMATEHGIKLYCYAEPSVGKKIVGDPARLTQIIINLLSNAVKFTNIGTVKLTADIINSTDKQATIYFEIKDSGIGMTQEQIARIFTPFMQADDSTSRKYGGTGLGLTITREFIELMGGELVVESAPGLGSKFSFELTFDLVDAFVDDNLMRKHDKTVIKKPKFTAEILVCEDNVMNQQMICEHLTRVGITTVIAQNGQDAVDIVTERMVKSKKPFDLIFMDIHMPVMNGLEAAERIMKSGVKTPIIPVTANIMQNDLEIYKEHGMSGFLGKPFTAQDLWKCLMIYLTPVSIVDIDKSHQQKEDEKLLKELRLNFVKNNQDTFDEIQKSINDEDFEHAKLIAHTLKSNAAQIDEELLRMAAADVEASFAKGIDVNSSVFKELMTSLKNQLTEVLDKLAPMFKLKKPEPVEFDPDLKYSPEVKELLRQLRPMLVDQDLDCMSYLENLRDIPGTEELAEEIENFEFGNALLVLDNLLARE